MKVYRNFRQEVDKINFFEHLCQNPQCRRKFKSIFKVDKYCAFCDANKRTKTKQVI